MRRLAFSFAVLVVALASVAQDEFGGIVASWSRRDLSNASVSFNAVADAYRATNTGVTFTSSPRAGGSYTNTAYLRTAGVSALSFTSGGADQAFSIDAFCYSTTWSNDAANCIISKVSTNAVSTSPSEWIFAILPSGALKFIFYERDSTARQTNFTSVVQVPTGRWAHVAVTYTGRGRPAATNVTLYIDGAADGSAVAGGANTYSNMTASAVTDVTVGVYFVNIAGTADWFYGQLDDVTIWNYCRASNDVSARAVQRRNKP